MDDIDLPLVSLTIKSIPGKGRGVFAGQHISSGELVNISPILLFPTPSSDESGNAERDILSHYTYTIGLNQGLALGLGSMFNHARRNNVGFTIDKANQVIRYVAISDIPVGAELCINYGRNLWFEDVDSTGTLSSDEDDLDDPFQNMEL